MGTPISSLPIASTPTGTEYVPVVQSGTTKRTTLLDAAKTLLPITTDEISDSNVTAAKLAADSVTTVKILDSNVTAAKLASGAAVSNIGTGGITATQLASNAVTTAKIADANITAAKLDGAQSGTAPIFGVRAWVNFNGTGTVATNQTIRAQGNVASVYKNGTGDYTITFTTSMPDTNYAWSGSAVDSYGSNDTIVSEDSRTAGTLRIKVSHGTSKYDVANVSVTLVR